MKVKQCNDGDDGGIERKNEREMVVKSVETVDFSEFILNNMTVVGLPLSN